MLGDPLALPASYVAADVTLGYASTAHAAEGRTVDSAHSVTDESTSLAELLAPLTRGREANRAWVVTTSLPADAETGQTLEVEPRTPAVVLADIMEGRQRERSALAEREQAEIDARSNVFTLTSSSSARGTLLVGDRRGRWPPRRMRAVQRPERHSLRVGAAVVSGPRPTGQRARSGDRHLRGP